MSIESPLPIDNGVTIANGKLIRAGFYRLNTDGNATKYAQSVATGNLDKNCVFCPPVTQNNMLESPDSFSAFAASAPYQYWDGRKVERHDMITPDDHVTQSRLLGAKAIKRLYDFVGDIRQTEGRNGITVQDYTRVERNPSKSVGHLHTHLLHLTDEYVDEIEYTISNGLKKLTFKPAKTDDEPVPVSEHWDAQKVIETRQYNPEDLIRPYRAKLGAAALIWGLETMTEQLQLSEKREYIIWQPYARLRKDGTPLAARIYAINYDPVVLLQQSGDDLNVQTATLTPEQVRRLKESQAA